MDYVVNEAGKKTSRPAVTTTTTTTTTTTKPSPANEETTRSVAVAGGGTGTGDQGGHTVTSGEVTQGGQSLGHVETEHDQKDFSCKPVDGQYSSYIEKNFEALKTKCQEFQKCTDELYSAENFHHVLAGKPILLSNMCDLLYKDPNNGYGGLGDKCSEGEREAIRQNLDTDLLRTPASPLDDSTRDTWIKLRRCLSRGGVSQNENLVNGVCRLKVRSMNETRLGYLCQDPAVDQVAQDFFNQKLERLHCSCEAPTARESTLKGALNARMETGDFALGCIVLFVIALVVIIVCLCRRGRKLKRQLSKLQAERAETNMDHSVDEDYREIGSASQDFAGMAIARSLVQSAGLDESVTWPLYPGYVNGPVTSQVRNNPMAGGIAAAQNRSETKAIPTIGGYIWMERTKTVYVNVDRPPVTCVEISSENDSE